MTQYDPASLVSSVPVLPAAAFKALELLEPRSTANFRDLEEAIKLDPALTSRFLRVANSAMYAQRSKVESLQTAISLLGFSMAKNLVLLVAASSSFDPGASDPFFTRFWRSSLRTAFYARYLAETTPHGEHADRLFTAGILYYMGTIGLHRADPAAFAAAEKRGGEDLQAFLDAERETFGLDHRAVCGSLLKGWNLPALYVDIALEYGSPQVSSRYKQLVLLFSLAESLSRRASPDALPRETLALAAAIPMGRDRLAPLKAEFERRLSKDPFAAQCGLILGSGATLYEGNRNLAS